MLFSRCGAFALLCLATLSASAQKYSFKAVTFSGYTASSQADLLAASGLTPSGQASSAELQAAAQKLNQTGLFAHIGYKLDGQTLSFQMEPATGLLPAASTTLRGSLPLTSTVFCMRVCRSTTASSSRAAGWSSR
jgi:hypothetical protein